LREGNEVSSLTQHASGADAAPQQAPLLHLDHVWKRYGKVVAVQDLSLECAKGELLVILGPSGAGKTSTLKMISGLEEVTSGAIRLNGRPINRLEPRDRNVAMVFEDYALYTHLTVFENLASPLRVTRVPAAGIQDRVQRIARMLGIDEFLDRRPVFLSGGQRQRVSLGRALIKDAVIHLMDEPISHLDAKLRHQMRGEFKRLQRELGLTIVYVTHDYREAMALADRILVLNRGRREQYGPPDEIYDRPVNTFVAALVGEPPMNLIPTAIDVSGTAVTLVAGKARVGLSMRLGQALQSAAPARRVIMGIRPNEIRLSLAPGVGAHPVEVYAFEPLGAATIYTLKLDEELMKVKAPGIGRVEIGQAVYVQFDEPSLHFFDATSQTRLSW
jgi:multiple sugar transport system ATP-binding protein